LTTSGDPEGAEVAMLAEFPRECREVFPEILAEIAGEFDGRTTGPWAFHVHLTLSLADDLVPTASEEPHILKPSHGQMRMNGPALLTFQDGYIENLAGLPDRVFFI
jgi:hypothetical protein